MNLKFFFDALPADFFPLPPSDRLLYAPKMMHLGHLPAWKQADVALLGVPEYRGEGDNQAEALLSIRQELYRMAGFSKKLRWVDLGNLRPGTTVEDTYQKLAEVCHTLMESGTIPLIIGGSHDLDIGQFWGYQSLDKMITVLNVDACLDLEADAPLPSDSHINRILTHLPNYLFEYSHLGYQRFYCPPKAINTLLNLNFELRSVGQIRDNLAEIEPQIRSADMMSFDISAIRRTDAAAVAQTHPFGLTGDEACQICWYAGLSDKLSSFGLYGYQTALDPQKHTASVIATMLWYFMEGVAHRQREHNFQSNFYIKYIVPIATTHELNIPHMTENLVFYKSKISEKWWMEVSAEGFTETHYNRNLVIPCSYSDFETANKGLLPDRWLKALDKLV